MGEAGFDLRGTVSLLRRQARLITFIFALCVGLAGIALVSLTPVYTATALILVDPSHADLLDPDPASTASPLDSARVDSEAEILRSDATLMEVIAALDLSGDPELTVGGRDALAGLKRTLNIHRRGITYLIAIDARSSDPARAAQLADAVAETHINAQLRAKINSALNAHDTLSARLTDAGASLAQSEAALDRFTASQPDLQNPEIRARLYALEQSATLARAQYQTLLSRSSALGVQVDLQLADARIVSRALPPARPSFPDPVLFLVLAALAGLGLGVGLAFARDHYIGGFTGSEQLSGVLRLPVLSGLPRVAEGAESAMISAPLSSFAEAVRRVRAGVDRVLVQHEHPGEGSVMTLASTSSGEGKTTLALALAHAYAQSGTRTLLIDCDLRNPDIHRKLGLAPDVGLIDYLTGVTSDQTLTGLVSRDPVSGLSILSGSRHSDIPTDQLVTGAAFTALIAAARRSFDRVILDTPALDAVVDGLHLARHADAVLLVVRAGATAQADVCASANQLAAALAPHTHLFALLNQQEPQRKRQARRRYTEAFDMG